MAICGRAFRLINHLRNQNPDFEHYEVISRSVGDTTDIVSKKCMIFMIKETVT